MIQWYAMRGTGVVTLVLFTLTVVLGLLNRSRAASTRWPRFVIDRLHRNASLLALVFLALHVATAVTDQWVSISFADAVIPFQGSYRPFWVGLGAVALDLLLALVLTSLIRVRLGVKLWRALHWLAYLAWPFAVLHGIGIGTDAGRPWMAGTDVICIAAVVGAFAVRLAAAKRVTVPAW